MGASRRAGSLAVVTAGEAKALLTMVDADMKALDDAVGESAVSDVFRRAWGQFISRWRSFFLDGHDQPPKMAVRKALLFAASLRTWRRALAAERPGNPSAGASDGDDVGALVVMPGAIKDEIETVNTGIKQLDADITSSQARPAFKNAWRAFVGEWQRFYASKQGWWARSWGGAYEKAVEYRKRVDEWRKALEREGIPASGPSLTPPLLPLTSSFKWLTVGALLVGGAMLGAKVLK